MSDIVFVDKSKTYTSNEATTRYEYKIFRNYGSTDVIIEGEKDIYYTSFIPTKQELLLIYENICNLENRVFDSKKYNMLLDLRFLQNIREEYKTIEDRYKIKELEYTYEGLYTNDEDYKKAFQEVEAI